MVSIKGFLLISNIKNECLEKLTSWCTRSIEELKLVFVLIVISNQELIKKF
jgi:hypothetical protein